MAWMDSTTPSTSCQRVSTFTNRAFFSLPPRTVLLTVRPDLVDVNLCSNASEPRSGRTRCGTMRNDAEEGAALRQSYATPDSGLPGSAGCGPSNVVPQGPPSTRLGGRSQDLGASSQHVSDSETWAGDSAGIGPSTVMPQAPPSVHPDGWSQEPQLSPAYHPHPRLDAGGGVWDYLFPGEQQQCLGASCSDEVLDNNRAGPNELHSRGWCAPIARWVPGLSVTASADCRGGEAPPEGRPSGHDDVDALDHDDVMEKGITEVGSISRRRKCKGMHRTRVKGAACHGSCCCGGT